MKARRNQEIKAGNGEEKERGLWVGEYHDKVLKVFH